MENPVEMFATTWEYVPVDDPDGRALRLAVVKHLHEDAVPRDRSNICWDARGIEQPPTCPDTGDWLETVGEVLEHIDDPEFITPLDGVIIAVAQRTQPERVTPLMDAFPLTAALDLLGIPSELSDHFMQSAPEKPMPWGNWYYFLHNGYVMQDVVS